LKHKRFIFGYGFFSYAIFPFVASILFNAAYNHDFLRIWDGDIFFLLSQKALITYLMFYSLFLILTLSRPIFAVLLPILVILSSITGYFMNYYKILELSSQSMAFVFESNIEETIGFIGNGLILSTTLSCIASVLVAFFFTRKLISPVSIRSRLWLIAASSVLCVIVGISSEFPTPLPLPFSLFEAGSDYLKQDYLFKHLSGGRKDISAGSTLEGDKDMVLVLIIGESARPDHFHVNGYSRQTTPQIEQTGVLSFNDVTSCSDSTRVSVPCMLTRATSQDTSASARETSLISIFKKVGFYTAWISNQRVRGDNDTPVTAIAKEASYLYFGNQRGDFIHIKLLDDDLLPVLDQSIQQPARRKLIILHTVGSHWYYEQHYSSDFRIFTPVCKRKEPRMCTDQELINSYDNTIFYTDNFIRQVIDRVAGLRSLVFYVSDHGESLGEEGRFSHGQGKEYPEQMKVPMLVWASPEFASTDPEKVAALKKNTTRALSHDDLFHSIPDCADIASPVVEKSMSVCR